jgi:hypothetical protein
MTTIAAFGCFIKGLDHIEMILDATLIAYSDEYQPRAFLLIHQDITWVLIAMATSMYFESVTSSMKELRIDIDTTEIRWHSLERVFMKEVYEKIPKDSDHATSIEPPVAIGCTFDAPDLEEPDTHLQLPWPNQNYELLTQVDEDKSITSHSSDDEREPLKMERIKA